MSQPSVSITELDGALGVLPPSAGKLLACVGTSSAGPLNVPSTFSKVKPLTAAFGSGPLVEAAAYHIERHGKPVVVVRTGSATPGASGALDSTAKVGSSVVTVTGTPTDDFEAVWKAVSSGTIGTAGISFVWSLDGGRTWSPVTQLGTATDFTFPGAGGLGLAFAAGTIAAGDTVSTQTTAPAPNVTELGEALDALAASSITWEQAEVTNPVDANSVDVLDLKMAALTAAGKYRWWSGNTRLPDVSETEATYRAALDTAFGATATTHGELCSGAAKITSSITGRKYRRPASFVVAARHAAVSEEINIADVNLGPLVGVSIRDLNGNPDEHDESINPGLDDARFTVLRTWEGLQGVYVNRPRLFSPNGSDFQLVPHRRVMNLGHAALRLYFLRRLNRPVIVSKVTGFILEDEALEIESGALGVLRSELLSKPKASDVMFALSRTDNLLSTFTMTGDARILPLAYPEFIQLTVGFVNPALQVRAV
jgi:hypothetical protein